MEPQLLEALVQEAAGLPPVSSEGASEYKAKLEALVAQVNRTLEEHPRVLRLVGYNPLTMMHDNHRNHARFMANVFRFQAWPLLVKTVVWAYRTYHNHGFSYDYFPVELAAWQQAVAELLPPAAGATILAVYRWLQQHHEDWVRLAAVPAPSPPRGMAMAYYRKRELACSDKATRELFGWLARWEKTHLDRLTALERAMREEIWA